jgi:hypothetical protein
VRGGKRSIRFAVSSSFRILRRTGTTLTNLAALLRGAVNAVAHRAKDPVLSTWIGPRSAGRELTTRSTLQPFFSSVIANACARVVLPAAGGPKSSTIIARTLRRSSARHRPQAIEQADDAPGLVTPQPIARYAQSSPPCRSTSSMRPSLTCDHP